MKRTGHWLSVLGLIALTTFAQSAWAATCTSKTGGPYNWDNQNTWTGCNNSKPRDGDAVIISGGSTVTLNVDTNQLVSLTVQAGGVLQGDNRGGQNLVDLSRGPGNLTNNGTITLTDNVLNLAGNFINNGSFSAGNSVTTFLGATPTIGGTSPTTFANLDLSQTTSVLLGNNVTVTGTFSGPVTLTSTCPTDYTFTYNNGTTVLHSCPSGVVTPAYLQYHMDETSWGGISGEVIDSSGNGLNGTAVNGATTASTTPALTGNPGTCGYGVFNGNNSYVALPSSFPNLTSNFTITAWIRTTNNANSGQRIFIDDQNNTGGYGFSLGDGGTGKLRFYARGSSQVILDTANVINSNTWYFVAAVADISNARRYIYVYDATGALVTSVNVNSSGWGTDNGAASIGGENNLSTETGPAFHFAGNIDEAQVFQSALTQTQLGTIAVQTHPCAGVSGSSTAGSFNAFESSTAANSTTGLLYTKLAGTAFGFDVVAIQTNGTAIANTFAGTVKVELVDVSTGAACAAAPLIQSVGTLTFAPSNAGRMTAPQTTVATAWANVKVRMTTPATGTATVVACSTDNFAIRPSSFTVTASAVPALGATIKVGSNFNFTATSNVSSGYTGTPAIVPASVFVDGTTTPITATNLVGAFAAATGAAATGTFQYNELGTITLNTDAVLDTSFTSLDQASGGCVLNSTSNVLSGGKYGCNIGSAVFGPLGRFIPDHFDTVVTQGCNTTGTVAQIFTYSGQPFTATITARGAATATPANKQMTKYAGTYAQTTSLTVVPASGTLSPLQALSSDFVSGVATKTLVFTFTTLPSVPAAITIRATDTDGVTSLGATEGAVNARAGRFSVSNALGADLYPLSVPWAVQYYGASGWITNPDDTCTAVPATSAIGLSNYKGGLTSTTVTAVTLLTAAPATAGNGAGVITLAKPNPKLTSSGSVWVSPPTLPSWLQPGVAGLANFSIFNGAKEFIYLRENY